MGEIIDGKSIAQKIEDEIKQTLDKLEGRKPCLAVIIVGEHAPSQIYVNQKSQACHRTGIRSDRYDLADTTSEEELLKIIEHLNNDHTVDGILVQLPLPEHINTEKIVEAVAPDKDVDGFHPINVGRMLSGRTDVFLPCTAAGIQHLLIAAGAQIEGKHVVIVGRSNIVGKPLAAILMQKAPGCNATVTVAHSRSENLGDLCLSADIIVAAAGQPHIITSDMIKEGAVIVDVGINRVDDPSKKRGYRLVGDVDFEAVKDKCSFITPVPGGVGPMTIAMLLKNTLTSYQRRR